MNVDLQALWRRGDKTVVFVTHSISEAVFLSDRVLVMSPRPARIVLDARIRLARPRRMRMRDGTEFTAYEQRFRRSSRRRVCCAKKMIRRVKLRPTRAARRRGRLQLRLWGLCSAS